MLQRLRPLYFTAGALGLGELGFHKPPWPKQNKTKTKQNAGKVVRGWVEKLFNLTLFSSNISII